MEIHLFFGLMGALLVLAFLANRMVSFTKVPDVVILMATGMIIGPLLQWVNPELFRGVTDGFGSLALILILFEGGLDLKLRELLGQLAGGFFLSLFSYALSTLAVAAILWYGLNLPWNLALMGGAVLGCVSSSIVLPVLQQTRLPQPVKLILLVESALGDAIAVLTVSILVEIAGGASASAQGVGGRLALSLAIAVAAALAAGVVWAWLLPMMSGQQFWNVLTFAAVLLLYAGVHAAHGNALVAVLVFGVTISNFRVPRWAALRPLGSPNAPDLPEYSFLQTPEQKLDKHYDAMRTFHGEIAFLIRTFFFVLIGAIVDFQGLRANAGIGMAVVGALFVARWLAIETGRPLLPRLRPVDRENMILLMPRGLITAVLAIQVTESQRPTMDFLPSVAFGAILITCLLLLIATVRAGSGPEPEPTADPAGASSPSVSEVHPAA